MPIIVDISEDKFLNEIFDAIEARREAIGYVRGYVRGYAIGYAQVKTEVTQRLIESGRVSLEEIAKIVKVSLDFVLDVQEKMRQAAMEEAIIEK
jgi:predicted transposase YdaD